MFLLPADSADSADVVYTETPVNTQYRIVCSGRAWPVFRLNLV